MGIQFTNYRYEKKEPPEMEYYPFYRDNVFHKYVIAKDGENLDYIKKNKKDYYKNVPCLDRPTYIDKETGNKSYGVYTATETKILSKIKIDKCKPFFDAGLVAKMYKKSIDYKINGLGMLAMYANESDWGRSLHCFDNNNLFNIKNSKWTKWGNYSYSYNCPDPVESSDPFYYAYPSVDDSIDAYCKLITTHESNYKKYAGYYYHYFNEKKELVIDKIGREMAINYWKYIKNEGYSTASAEYEKIIDSVINRLQYLYKSNKWRL